MGYNEETTLDFYHINGSTGEAFELEIEEIEDDDRECNVDSIGVLFKKPKEYIKSESEISVIDIRDALYKAIDSVF